MEIRQKDKGLCGVHRRGTKTFLKIGYIFKACKVCNCLLMLHLTAPQQVVRYSFWWIDMFTEYGGLTEHAPIYNLYPLYGMKFNLGAFIITVFSSNIPQLTDENVVKRYQSLHCNNRLCHFISLHCCWGLYHCLAGYWEEIACHFHFKLYSSSEYKFKGIRISTYMFTYMYTHIHTHTHTHTHFISSSM